MWRNSFFFWREWTRSPLSTCRLKNRDALPQSMCSTEEWQSDFSGRFESLSCSKSPWISPHSHYLTYSAFLGSDRWGSMIRSMGVIVDQTPMPVALETWLQSSAFRKQWVFSGSSYDSALDKLPQLTAHSHGPVQIINLSVCPWNQIAFLDILLLSGKKARPCAFFFGQI